jgi:hypothetical protein
MGDIVMFRKRAKEYNISAEKRMEMIEVFLRVRKKYLEIKKDDTI